MNNKSGDSTINYVMKMNCVVGAIKYLCLL